MGDLKVTQFKSAIGSKPKQRGTLRALGLGRIGKTNTLPDRPEIRGMLAKVPHLVRVEASDSSPADGASASEPGGDGRGAQPGAGTESEA
jgi:large subunit ribosomal protein L30